MNTFNLIRSIALITIISLMFPEFGHTQKTKAEKVDKTCKGLPINDRTRVAVARFSVTTPSANGKFGENLSAMLSNALVETNCFRVLESSKNLEDLSKEIELNNSGMIKEGSGPEAGQMMGAQLLVSGEITEFSENESGGGGGGLLGGVIGGVGMMKAHVGFILKVVNPTTRDILASRSFERKVSKIGAVGGGVIGGIPVGGLGFKSKAMADAVEEAILAASRWLVEEKPLLVDATAGASENKNKFGKGNCPALLSGQGPTVMVIIPEIHIAQRIPDPAGETEIIRKLIEAGFKVLDPSVYKAIRESEKLNTALKDANAASKLGAQFGADVIIIGEAFSESAGTVSGNMRSCRARVEARAVRTSNGQIIGADGRHAGGTDITEFTAAKVALRNAGALMGDYFLEQLCQSQSSGTGGTGSTGATSSEIVLSNINFSSLGKIETGLKGISGVQQVKKSMNGKVGKIELTHTGSLDDIATFLSEGKAGVPVEIMSFDGNKIEGVLK